MFPNKNYKFEAGCSVRQESNQYAEYEKAPTGCWGFSFIASK